MRKKRYSIKPQDDYFGIVDEYNEDRVCIVNGIHTKLEAEWLCDELNGLHDENVTLKVENEELRLSRLIVGSFIINNKLLNEFLAFETQILQEIREKEGKRRNKND